jgi:hypothetical protein
MDLRPPFVFFVYLHFHFCLRVGGIASFAFFLFFRLPALPHVLSLRDPLRNCSLFLFSLVVVVLPWGRKDPPPITEGISLYRPIPNEDAFFRKGDAGPILKHGHQGALFSLARVFRPGCSLLPPRRTHRHNSREGECDARGAMSLAPARVKIIYVIMLVYHKNIYIKYQPYFIICL